MRKAGYAITRKSEVARLVLEATSSDPWGPKNSQMQEIARLSQSPENYRKITKHMWKRIGDKKEVRRIQKGMILLEYLLANGSERFRSDTKMMTAQLQMLSRLHKHETGEPAAIEAVIRKKAEIIMQMLTDDEFFQMERDKASKLRSTLSSVSYQDDQSHSTYSTYTPPRDPYGLHDQSPQQTQEEAKPDDSDYSYYSDEEPQPMNGGQGRNPYSPTTQQQAANPFSMQPGQSQQPPTAQQQFDVFKQAAPQQQTGWQQPVSDPFGSPQHPPSAQQQFDVFQQAQQQPQVQQAWPQQSANPFGQPQQQPANPFGQPQQQPANPFGQPQPQQQQTFWQQQPVSDPFGQQQFAQPQQQPASPFGQPQPQQQQTFWQQSSPVASPFGAQPQPQQQGFWQQQATPQAQPVSADEMLFGTAAPQPKPQPQTSSDQGGIFLDLSGPAQPAPAQRRPQARPLQDDLSDLVDLNLRNNSLKKDYGRPTQQRGQGPTLGSGHGL